MNEWQISNIASEAIQTLENRLTQTQLEIREVQQTQTTERIKCLRLLHSFSTPGNLLNNTPPRGFDTVPDAKSVNTRVKTSNVANNVEHTQQDTNLDQPGSSIDSTRPDSPSSTSSMYLSSDRPLVEHFTYI